MPVASPAFDDFEPDKIISAMLGPTSYTRINLAANDVSKTPKLRRFRMWAQLKFAGCADMDARPEFVRECRFDDKSRTFECEDTFVETATLSLEDLEAAEPKATAQNIRWVLENADELRENGFRFPKGFLEELPNHLPEDG